MLRPFSEQNIFFIFCTLSKETLGLLFKKSHGVTSQKTVVLIHIRVSKFPVAFFIWLLSYLLIFHSR